MNIIFETEVTSEIAEKYTLLSLTHSEEPATGRYKRVFVY